MSYRISGRGLTSVTGFQYRNGADLQADVDELDTELGRLLGVCDAGEGRSPWNDRAGRRCGWMWCQSEDGRFYIVWSDEASNRRFTLAAADAASAHRWWQATLRPQGAFPTSAESRLLRLLDDTLDVSACERDGYQSPLALTEVACDSARPLDPKVKFDADRIQFALFDNVDDLHQRIDLDRNAFAPSLEYDGEHETYLRHDGPTYSLWRSTPSNEYRGRLLGFAARSAFWVTWTLDKTLLHGRVGREDQQPGKTLEAFHGIGHVGLS